MRRCVYATRTTVHNDARTSVVVGAAPRYAPLLATGCALDNRRASERCSGGRHAALTLMIRLGKPFSAGCAMCAVESVCVWSACDIELVRSAEKQLKLRSVN